MNTKPMKRAMRLVLSHSLPRETRRRIIARFPRAPLTSVDEVEAAARFDAAFFERHHSTPDPWSYESEHAQSRYADLLDVIGNGPFERALEVACSVGVFTKALASRCGFLLAVDISANALRQAHERVGHLPNVRLERRMLPHETPAGPFDLIVCSDVLHYWPGPELSRGLVLLERALAPGGRLVALHHIVPSHKISRGYEVHEQLRRETSLTHTGTHQRERYLIDTFDRPADTASVQTSSSVAD